MALAEHSWQAEDNLPIYAREWRPASAPRAVVVLIHGLGEHSGRYDHVADALNAAGYAVFAPDLRGHGRSAGRRGHIPSYDFVMDQIDRAFKEAGRLYPGLPQFLYGHSLGGNLVLYYALTRKASLRGVISSSPGLEPGMPVPGIKLTLGKLLYNLAPSFTMPNGLPLQGLSRDPVVFDALAKDPYYHTQVSARLGLDLINQGAWIQSQNGPFPFPLLLLHGTADQLTNHQATRRFADGLSGDVTLREWEGWYHELHNEPGKAQVFQVIITWLNAHC